MPKGRLLPLGEFRGIDAWLFFVLRAEVSAQQPRTGHEVSDEVTVGFRFESDIVDHTAFEPRRGWSL